MTPQKPRTIEEFTTYFRAQVVETGNSTDTLKAYKELGFTEEMLKARTEMSLRIVDALQRAIKECADIPLDDFVQTAGIYLEAAAETLHTCEQCAANEPHTTH